MRLADPRDRLFSSEYGEMNLSRFRRTMVILLFARWFSRLLRELLVFRDCIFGQRGIARSEKSTRVRVDIFQECLCDHSRRDAITRKHVYGSRKFALRLDDQRHELINPLISVTIIGSGSIEFTLN